MGVIFVTSTVVEKPDQVTAVAADIIAFGSATGRRDIRRERSHVDKLDVCPDQIELRRQIRTGAIDL